MPKGSDSVFPEVTDDPYASDIIARAGGPMILMTTVRVKILVIAIILYSALFILLMPVYAVSGRTIGESTFYFLATAAALALGAILIIAAYFLKEKDNEMKPNATLTCKNGHTMQGWVGHSGRRVVRQNDSQLAGRKPILTPILDTDLNRGKTVVSPPACPVCGAEWEAPYGR